jgi:hypothetical protein
MAACHGGGDVAAPEADRLSRPGGAVVEPVDDGSTAGQLKGYVAPSIADKKVRIATLIVSSPSPYSRSWIGHEGGYTITVKGKSSTNVSIPKVSQNVSEVYGDLAMSLTYDPTKDTVTVTASAQHSGYYVLYQTNTEGRYPTISSSGADKYEAPKPESPPPAPPSGRGNTSSQSAGGDIYCWFRSDDGGQTWTNTGICWVQKT